jgi:hypothetical protein
LGLVVILALLVWRKTGGRKREDQATSAPSIWDALQEATLPADPDAARQTLYDWHHDLRRGVDRALGTDRGACIDAHWIEQTRAAAGARSYPWADLERVLEELERLKYQQPMPGRLTLEGVGERVRSLAAALRMAEQVPSATVSAETTGKSATAREEANV